MRPARYQYNMREWKGCCVSAAVVVVSKQAGIDLVEIEAVIWSG